MSVAFLFAAVVPLAISSAAAAASTEVTTDQVVIYIGKSGYNNVTLQVVNDMEIRNNGDEAVPRVEVPVASGYLGPTIDRGADANDVEWLESSFVDPRGLKAGESRQYSFSYSVAYPALPNLLLRPVLHPTRQLIVVVPAEELEIEPHHEGILNDLGMRAWGEARAHVYESASPLEPDEGFVLTVKHVKTGISPWFWAWVLLLGLPVVGLSMIFWRGARMKRSRVREGAP